MNKVLITGASGFLGTILADVISNHGYSIFSLGRNSSNNYNVDLSSEVPNFEDSFDIVVHAAGKAHSIPKTIEQEQEFFDVNLTGTINLCNALDKLEEKPRAFVFISTVSVYGLDEGIGITEDYPLLGATAYAQSKIQAEEYLTTWARDNGVILTILRLPLIAGRKPLGNLGMMIEGIKTGRYLSVGNASARKSIVWANDIGEVIPKVAIIGGTYNLTDSYHPTFAELEENISMCVGKGKPKKIPILIAKCLGLMGDFIGNKFPVNSDKLKKITSSLTFDDSKAKEKLDWLPTNVLGKIEQIIKF